MNKYLNNDDNNDKEEIKRIYYPKLGLNMLYVKNFISIRQSKIILRTFEKQIIYNPPEESKIFIIGKYIDIPRSIVAYGEPWTFYKFSGMTVRAKSWLEDGPIEKILRMLVDKLEGYIGVRFNSVLINRYKDGKQYIGYHQDGETDLIEKPIIAGISFGATRTISFQHIDGPGEIKLNLGDGSLLLIKHPANQNWGHSILGAPNMVGVGISLTFRKMKPKN